MSFSVTSVDIFFIFVVFGAVRVCRFGDAPAPVDLVCQDIPSGVESEFYYIEIYRAY